MSNSDFYERRNWKIYMEWIEGKEYWQLARDFNLGQESIKDICKKLLPEWVRGKPGLSANGYRKFREWKRKKNQDRDELEKFIYAMEKDPK